MTNQERDAIASLIENAMDKLSMEDIDGANVLLNRALYWLAGYDDDDYEDGEDPKMELQFDEGD